MHDDAAAALESLRRFLAANTRRDDAAMLALLSRRTRDAGGFSGSTSEFDSVTLGEPEPHSDGWMIPIEPGPEFAATRPPLPAIMIFEDGDWKLDLVASIELLYGGPEGLEQLAEEMLSALGEATGEAIDSLGLIAAAVGDTLSTYGDDEDVEPGSLAARLIEAAPALECRVWDDVQPYPSHSELETLPPTFALPATTAAVSEALGFEVRAVVTFNEMHWPIEDDLRAQIDGYITWLEDEFMKPWIEVLPTIARFVPLIGRMNCLRFEPVHASSWRYLVADGNAIVLRMATGENVQAIGPNQLVALGCGVAAALPEEILPQFDGTTRQIPAEGTPDAGQAWFDHVAPRQMKRISDMIGRNVRLCADPAGLLLNDERDLRLYRSGLGRILGGIGLALGDPAYAGIVRTQLHTIWIDDELIGGRELRFENGILRCTVPVWDDDQTGDFVEHQVASAFGGETLTADDRAPGSET